MQVLGVLLIISGLITGGVGVWRKKNPSGPIFYGGQVNDSIRELFGSSRPGTKTVVTGAALLIAGIILVFIA